MKHITTLVTASIVAIVTLIKSVFLHPGCTVVRSCIHPQSHCRESVRSSYNISFGLYKGRATRPHMSAATEREGAATVQNVSR